MGKKIVAFNIICGFLLAGIIVMSFNVSHSFAQVYADSTDAILNLNNTLNDKMGLPSEANASYTPINYQLDDHQTIELVFASKHDSYFVRLNKLASSSDAPSYFRKKEECKGMTSITMRLNYGQVNVYTGFEKASNDPDVDDVIYTNKYIIKKTSGEITFPVEGNYFKVENNTVGTNALVNYFSVNYGCTEQKTAATPEYTMVNGYNSTVDANRGKWYYLKNGTSNMGTCTFSNNRIDAFINTTAASPNNIVFRYKFANISAFNGDEASITMTVEVDQTASIKVVGTTSEFVANTPTDITLSKTVNSSYQESSYDTGLLYFQSDETNLTVSLTNILVIRTIK